MWQPRWQTRWRTRGGSPPGFGGASATLRAVGPGKRRLPSLSSAVGSGLLGLLLFGLGRPPIAIAQEEFGAFGDDPPVTEAELEAALSPSGDWEEVPSLGRVWQPSAEVVGEDFVPYASNGQWLYSGYGWTFDSNYPWGWAAFHFGRWIFLAELGWAWAPGLSGDGALPVWGPAWVAWRTEGDVVGWVPAPPRGATFDPHQYASLWSVVAMQHFQGPELPRHMLGPGRLSALARVAPPPGAGTPLAPLARWRGYPHLRAALTASMGGQLFLAPPPSSASASAILWTGIGASVHAPLEMGHAAGASPLWTGPGSSVFASPGFGPSAYGPGPARTPTAAIAAPRPTRR